MNKIRIRIPGSGIRKIQVFCFLHFFLFFPFFVCSAQFSDELEFNLDVNSSTVALPKIYKPSIDLSGRGIHRDASWPQAAAAKEAQDAWQADLGFGNFYRIQYNLWDIQQQAGNKTAQEKLLNNYEEVIKKISSSGGTVILDLFGTPHGWGRVLDKNSALHNLKEYKALVKDTIRRLSCEKKYNIWYEVWNAPDLGDFFLGGRSEYLVLYRTVAEAVKELRQETKMQIPLGGPSVSAWFKNIQPNNMLSPEGGLIYDLIKYCYNYRLPLDFISWHAYSSDPQEDKQSTIYNKPFVSLIREWLSYFHFDSNMPLIIDEWNFDGSANILPERGRNSNVAASYIPARLKNMSEARIDYQTYFCLEDFGGGKGSVSRNLGVFSFDLARSESKSYAKSSYNIFRMLNLLGDNLFTSGVNDDFVGLIATKSQGKLALLIYNYIDPQAPMNYLSRNIVYLNSSDRKALLNILKSDRMEKILSGQLDISAVRLGAKARGMLARAIELKNLVNKFSVTGRKLKITLKGLKYNYAFSRYIVDSKCSRDCEFKAGDEKDVDFGRDYVETVELSPYSAQLLIFKEKPVLPAAVSDRQSQPAALLENAVKPQDKIVEARPVKKDSLKEEKNAESGQ